MQLQAITSDLNGATFDKPRRSNPLFGIAAIVLFLASNAAGSTDSTSILTETRIKAVDVRRRARPRPDILKGADLSAGGKEPVAAAGLPAPLADTFKLHSHPTATKTIYIDFDGHNGVDENYDPYDFDGTPSSFSDAELTEIQKIWAAAAEKFRPFELNVTTEEPPAGDLVKTGGADSRWGIRAVVDSVDDDAWSWMDVFTDSVDYDCKIGVSSWSTAGQWRPIAATIAHEVGHSLGLDHQGDDGSTGNPVDDYYWGHDADGTAQDFYWCPIMGGTWTDDVWTDYVYQWSKGEYTAASSNQDDIAVITSGNGFGYRSDDHGSVIGTATELNFTNASLAFVAEGIIERDTDLDYFAFSLAASQTVQFTISPAEYGGCLDILARIHNSTGTAIYTSDVKSTFSASFNVVLAAGTYYLSIDGTGYGDPGTTYSDYGSLGYYSVQALGQTGVVQPVLNLGTGIGESISLSWAETGFKLQITTNLLVDAWGDYPGLPASPFSLTPTNGCSFFRLIEE